MAAVLAYRRLPSAKCRRKSRYPHCFLDIQTSLDRQVKIPAQSADNAWGHLCMATMEKPSSFSARRQAGYFCHLAIDRKHLGGILITNQVGVPLEFKYTEPVTTTKLHKILYGASLEKYLHETVIRDRLIREIRTVPDYFIAPYDEKEYIGSMAGKEMMAIQACPAGSKETTGAFTRVREREAIIELDEGPMMRVVFSTSDDSVQRSMVTWLQEMARTMDVIEPLERVVNALNTLCGEEKKA